MKRHYVDQAKNMERQKIKNHCIANYKDAELQVYRDREAKKEKELDSKELNQIYLDELVKISEKDQQERKKNNKADWDIQNKLDKANRLKLDSLYQLYGFPSIKKVSSNGSKSAFMLLHHSTDCKWNEKWTKRFLDHPEDIPSKEIFAYYFYRNFDEEGTCVHNLSFIDELKKGKNGSQVEKYMDFNAWKKMEAK